MTRCQLHAGIQAWNLPHGRDSRERRNRADGARGDRAILSKGAGVIDNGLAADRPTADTYTREANGLRREGVIQSIN